ncbi:MAG: hypothetical protein HYX34_04330 [Actinobacteria bacterium]|nr:hypothetical protein [Actinomycetota bacterium]
MLPLGPVLAAAAVPPAGGSALGEIAAASVVASLAIVAVAAVGWAHRTRGVLGPFADRIERRSGQPAWAVVPGAVVGVSLAVAVFGYYWDVSWHIDRGRDPGAFANPAHWFIIVGLDGIALAGVLALILGDRQTRTSVRLRGGWHVPVAGLMLTLCGVVALAGFPLDDIWHRLFGQDVTAWGPTHIMMIGGASLSTLAVWALQIEGARAVGGDAAYADAVGGDAVRREAARREAMPRGAVTGAGLLDRLRDAGAAGGFLLGLSTLQVEFDFGVPQFRALFHPVLIALAAGIGLVAARVRCGRGGAIAAAAFFVAVRGGLSLAIAGAFGRSVLHFPLYLVEAAVVEVVALAVPRGRQLTLGAVAGFGIGTVGFAGEWVWSRLWMPNPWTRDLLPGAVPLVVLAGIAAGLLGGFVGRALLPVGEQRQPTPRLAALLAWGGFAAVLALPLPMTEQTSWTATISSAPAPARGGERWVDLTVRTRPADAARDASWFNVIAWQGRKQGDGGLVISNLRRQGDGSWRTAQPVPIDGTWKTLLRLATGSSLQVVAIRLPEDAAIPAPAVTQTSGTYAFVRDKSVLQREAKTDNVNLERAAYVLLGAIAVAWLTSFSWGLRRLDPAARRRRAVPGRAAVRRSAAAEARVPTGAAG